MTSRVTELEAMFKINHALVIECKIGMYLCVNPEHTNFTKQYVSTSSEHSMGKCLHCKRLLMNVNGLQRIRKESNHVHLQMRSPTDDTGAAVTFAIFKKALTKSYYVTLKCYHPHQPTQSYVITRERMEYILNELKRYQEKHSSYENDKE